VTSGFPELAEGEVPLGVSDDCLVLRHVHPQAIDGDKVESWAFAPNSGDDCKMSVTQPSQVDARTAFEEYTATHKSAGMWGLTTAEVDASGTRVIDDQAANPDLPAGHAFIDYRDLDKQRKITKHARKLRDTAVNRGRQFPV